MYDNKKAMALIDRAALLDRAEIALAGMTDQREVLALMSRIDAGRTAELALERMLDSIDASDASEVDFVDTSNWY